MAESIIRKNLFGITLAVAAASSFLPGSVQEAYALPVESYAASSALAEGKWHKVRVSNSGMQFISNAALASMGFSDPSKVYVYGYGGRVISEVLNFDQIDDLPLIPCVRTSSGLIFFGLDHTAWGRQTSASLRKWVHTMHPYSENSYYFLSDRAPVGDTGIESSDRRDCDNLQSLDAFTERIAHESDIFAPANSGRRLFGEDLRNGATLQLTFPTPDNADGSAIITACLASHIMGSQGIFTLSSNAELSRSTINTAALSKADSYYSDTSNTFSAQNCGDNLTLGISFKSSGTVKFARLDYVEVEYQRRLRMKESQLYFYFNEVRDKAVTLAGCSAETQIWDVTTPEKPVRIEFQLDGSTARFRTPSGVREYIAFNPSKISQAPVAVGAVGNQNLHALEIPDMLIITPPEYAAAAERVAALHRELDDMTVHVLTPEAIYNEFSSGNPDVSAFRKILKMWYDRSVEDTPTPDGTEKLGKIRYCLLMGRPTYDNKGATAAIQSNPYPRLPIWQSPSGTTESGAFSTDDFIGQLDDCVNTAYNINTAKLRVAVGRFPVRSAQEAASAVDKLEKYVRQPIAGQWRNNGLIIADDGDSGEHLKQAENMLASINATDAGKRFNIEKLYFDAFPLVQTPTGAQFPEAKQRLLAKFDEGAAFMVYIGHANTVSWSHEQVLLWGDINSFSNEKLPILYAPTCEFLRWDADEYSGGEVMWANPSGGIIAGYIPSRSVKIFSNGILSQIMGNYLLAVDKDGSAPRLGEVLRLAKNATGGQDNSLRYCVVGDPAMSFPIPSRKVTASTIQGKSLNVPSDSYPVVKARSTVNVKGAVTNHDGSTDAAFNGKLYVTLMDAEMTFQTLGSAKESPVMTYNDRKSRLFEGVCNVVNGEWEIDFPMPLEINNNWSPARLLFYAVDDTGAEATGATDHLYVYGYDSSATEDSEGPEILQFYINNEGFVDGGLVTSSPVVFATMRDESGINISNVGIGHSLMLTLDDNTIYNDVATHYTADPDVPGQGSIAYQLENLQPGRHTLKLSVWDNANNSSYASITFNVAAAKAPEIYELSTDCNPASTNVVFSVTSDRPLMHMECTIDVFDLMGRKVWSGVHNGRTSADSRIDIPWDLTDANGMRLDRGIYLYRATLDTPDGRTATKTKRLAVTAQ